MHIMEGYLPASWAALWYIIAMPIVAYGAIKLIKLLREKPELKITVALSGAFIFVLSALKLPSLVGGSSSHPTGTGLSSALYGPAITAVLSTIVLLFQALLLAHGGITSLGANVFSMGIAGPAVGYVVYKTMRKAKFGIAPSMFATAALADLVTYIVTSMQLALAFPADVGGFLASFVDYLGIFAAVQIPLAIIEGIIFAIFADYLMSVRPESFENCKIRLRRKKSAPERD